ncbi:hypothetical protein AL714_11595 [Clostridium botulinum]|uniref:hypothetical protein n=1 Tax=Clostridium botulinum TaxID=1491 RepID=UPI00099C0D44|nr:hypothetical protein [Clostridium botulinum]MCC5440355.1 hypothetical protein [Clostridium botulinum]NFR57663.1 hypothetical protein [Clostridium botulinum]OPD36815.1 hypothetical protein AL714_11595 [Clostridium botulinum]
MITIEDIKEHQEKMQVIKVNEFKACDFKALGRELRDRFNLTDRQAINILNNKTDEILEILKSQ